MWSPEPVFPSRRRATAGRCIFAPPSQARPPRSPLPTPSAPLLQNLCPSPANHSCPSQGFVKVYTRILLAGAAPSGPFATILRHLATPSPSPILIHCTAGKDRTGVIVALILSLCGVSDAAVAHEYSLTDLGLGARKEEFVTNLIAGEPLRGDRPAAERMVSSRRESMMATLAMVRERWGGVEAFVRGQIGLREEEVEAIRKNLVVDVQDDGEVVDWKQHAELMP